MKQETLEEAAERLHPEEWDWKEREIFIEGAKWQQERSQQIIPFDAYNIEVFAIKPDENGKLFAYIGYKITNGNFHFNVVPFTEPQQEGSYSEEEVLELLQKALTHKDNGETGNLITAQGEIRTANFYSWFEQNKKK